MVRSTRPDLGKPHFSRARSPVPKPTTLTLASGQLNRSDQLDVELHRPASEPAFILVKWPDAPSIASPDNFDSLVAGCIGSCPCPHDPGPDAG